MFIAQNNATTESEIKEILEKEGQKILQRYLKSEELESLSNENDLDLEKVLIKTKSKAFGDLNEGTF